MATRKYHRKYHRKTRSKNKNVQNALCRTLL